MIKLRFVAERDFSTRVIDWFSAGWWSHVGVITDDGRYEFGARVAVNGSLTGRPGVQYRSVGYAAFTRVGYVELACTSAQHDAFWAAADRVVDRPYSKREIFGFVLHEEVHDDEGFICSSLAPWLLDRAGMLPGELRGREGVMTPQAVYYLTLGLRDGIVRREVERMQTNISNCEV